MHTIHKVRDFHERIGETIADKINDMTPEVRATRVRIIASELLELCQAWGVALRIEYEPAWDPNHPAHLTTEAHLPFAVDHVKGADALGDMDCALQGANLVAGYPSEPVSDEIHLSNMTKDPIDPATGKAVKGPNYVKADIAAVLARFPNGYWALYDPDNRRFKAPPPPLPFDNAAV